jgi:hypothetical protein
MMKHLRCIPLFILLTCSCYSQEEEEKITFADRLYSGDMASRFHYVQGRFSWSPSNLSVGAQYKRTKSDNEAGVFTFETGQTFSLNYTRLNHRDLINTNVEVHFRSYPMTAGIIRIGAGIDYSTDFHQTNLVSVYPSLGLDIGGIELIYSYLINGYKSSEMSDHRITLCLGLWVKSKKLR